MKKSIGSIVGLAVLMAMGIGTGYAEVYFQDDFNTGGTAGALSRGWQFIENEHVTEVGSNFVIAPEWPKGRMAREPTQDLSRPRKRTARPPREAS